MKRKTAMARSTRRCYVRASARAFDASIDANERDPATGWRVLDLGPVLDVDAAYARALRAFRRALGARP